MNLPPRTTVVNITQGKPYHIYIGRKTGRLKESEWANPFERKGQTREERRDSLYRYEMYIRARPHLVSKLKTLKGKKLGCWCPPDLCHGHILVSLIEAMERGEDIQVDEDVEIMLDIAEYYADMPEEDFHKLMGAYKIADFEMSDFRHHPEGDRYQRIVDQVCSLRSDPVGLREYAEGLGIQSAEPRDACGKANTILQGSGQSGPDQPTITTPEREMELGPTLSLFWQETYQNDTELGLIGMLKNRKCSAISSETTTTKMKSGTRESVYYVKMKHSKTRHQDLREYIPRLETIWEENTPEERSVGEYRVLDRVIKAIKDGSILQKPAVEVNTEMHLTNSEFRDRINRVENTKENLEEERVPVWSILTDNITYPKDHSIQETPFELETLKMTSKKAKEHLMRIQDHPNQNIPIGEDSYLNDRYQEVSSTLVNGFNPEEDICATYLWSSEGAIEHETTSEFKKGSFGMTRNCITHGYLLNETKIPVVVLNDSGATKPLIRRKFVEQNEFMDKYPRYKIKKQSIITANGNLMYVTECLKFLISLGGHVIELVAYIADMADDLDLIIGSKAYMEMEADLELSKQRVSFVKRSLPIYCKKKVTIKPGETKTVTMTCPNIPKDFLMGPAIVKMNTGREDKLPQTMLAHVYPGGNFDLKLVNKSKNAMEKGPNSWEGTMDLRSIGYFYQARDALSYSMRMQDTVEFLNEKDSEQIAKEAIEHTTRIKVGKNFNPHQELTPEELERLKVDPKDKWPWLDEDDHRRFKTDEQLIHEFVDLSMADLTSKEKKKFYKVLKRHREAFSLRDEIGVCPKLTVELALNDETPFSIRPYPVKESNKRIIDKEMRRGVLLGILKRGMSSYSSPIMLIPRPGNLPRIITDFRYLNSRLIRLNPSMPLVRDCIQTLGAAECEVMSVIDLKDAYHTLRLTEWSKKFCGITPYYGSSTYVYQRLGMGLSVSPAIWQNFMNQVLDEMPSRKHHLAIMDDCLVYSKKDIHMSELENLFKALIENGLKISPKKCQFFRKELKYMGHTILIHNNVPHIQAHKNRIEAIKDMRPPRSPRDCKKFCGMVIFLSMYLQDLQKILIPIYELTRKKTKFVWGPEQQKAFETIKDLVTQPPVLVMPNTTDPFVLFSDTSIEACGAALYQVQKGVMKLVAFNSKKLIEAARRYSITELELYGLLLNIDAFTIYLSDVEFTVYVDHSALITMFKAKRQPRTPRLMRMIEGLAKYCFTIHYHKGKDMLVCDYLSRHPQERDAPNKDVEPISFTVQEIEEIICEDKEISEKANRVKNLILTSAPEEICMVVTRSKVGKTPSMYPLKGETRQPEQTPQNIIEEVVHKIESPQHTQKTDKQKSQSPQTVNTPRENRNTDNPKDLDTELTETEEKKLRPIEPIYPRLDKKKTLNPVSRREGSLAEKLLQQHAEHEEEDRTLNWNLLDATTPEEMEEVDMTLSEEQKKRKIRRLFREDNPITMVREHIPFQKDLEAHMEKLKRRIIHDTKLPVSIKELKASYPRSPYFKHIYQYLHRGTSPFKGKADRRFRNECENYILCNGVLFRIIIGRSKNEEPQLRLCITEELIPHVLYMYHDTLMAGHQGVTRTALTIKQRFQIPYLIEYLRRYIKGCITCQTRSKKLPGMKANYARVPDKYRPMAYISIDCKQMPPSNLGYNHILICTCEVTNFVVAVSLVDLTSTTLFDALFFRVINLFGNPERIISDEAGAFTGKVFQALYKASHIKQILVSPENHGSLRTERYIQTMNNMLCKHLTDTGGDWPLYVHPCAMAMNTFVSPNTGFSPYEMVFLHKPPDITRLEFDPTVVTGQDHSTKQYLQIMQDRYNVIRKLATARRIKLQEMQLHKERRKNPADIGYAVGDLVLLLAKDKSDLSVPSKKLEKPWVGPVQIKVIHDDTHYTLADLQGKLLPVIVNKNRIKPFAITFGCKEEDTITNLKTLRATFRKIREEKN